MSLSSEERQKLTQEILDDLPEGFSIFPPWLSLFLLQLFSLILSLGFGAIVLQEAFGLEPNVLVFLSFSMFLLLVIMPNIFLMSGRMKVGMVLVRVSSMSFVVIFLVGFLVVFARDSRVMVLGWLAPALALLTFFISYTVKLHVFAAYRQRMVAWSKERLKKNKAFKGKKN